MIGGGAGGYIGEGPYEFDDASGSSVTGADAAAFADGVAVLTVADVRAEITCLAEVVRSQGGGDVSQLTSFDRGLLMAYGYVGRLLDRVLPDA